MWLLAIFVFFSFSHFIRLCFSSLQVTYRVVQVTDQHLEGRDDAGGAVSVVSTAAFAGAPQAVAQVPKSYFFWMDWREMAGTQFMKLAAFFEHSLKDKVAFCFSTLSFMSVSPLRD